MNNPEHPEPVIDDVIRGLIYVHNRANANTAAAHEANAALCQKLGKPLSADQLMLGAVDEVSL